MDQNRDVELKDRNYEEMEIDLLDLLAFYSTKLKWIIGGFLTCAIAAALITAFAITPMYTATAKMYMVSSSTQSVVDLTDLNIGTSISNDYVELLKTRPIIESVIKEEKLNYSYKQLLDMLNLSVINDTRIIRINVTSADPREAMNIANALADQGVSELPKLMETPEPHIAEYAIIPVNKSSPSLTKNTMIGALLGLLLMLAIFTIQYLMDDTFKTAEDIEKEFGIMPMTVIPEGKIGGLMDEVADDEIAKRSKKRKKRIVKKKNPEIYGDGKRGDK